MSQDTQLNLRYSLEQWWHFSFGAYIGTKKLHKSTFFLILELKNHKSNEEILKKMEIFLELHIKLNLKWKFSLKMTDLLGKFNHFFNENIKSVCKIHKKVFKRKHFNSPLSEECVHGCMATSLWYQCLDEILSNSWLVIKEECQTF